MELQQLMNHFSGLYGPRNRVFLNSLADRIGFLSIAVVDLNRALRKQVSPDLQAIAVARVVSRIFCIIEYFGEYLPFLEVFCRKYSAVCPYCQRSICVCEARRPDPQLAAEASEEQLHWSLTEWCRHLNTLYGANNAQLPIESLVSHLHEETVEVLSLAMKSPRLQMPAETILHDIADELSDALGWAIGIANVLGIDLAGQLAMRYLPDCWKCHQFPCICGSFSYQQVDWHQLANP